MKLIETTKGKFAKVDDEDYFLVLPYNWYANQYGEHWRAAANVGGRKTYMHQLIMNPTLGQIIDHIDRDGMNNQRSNLRIVTKSVNAFNCGLRSDNSSGVKGISWNKRECRWRAYIFINGKEKHLGYFKNKEDAIKTRLIAEESIV